MTSSSKPIANPLAVLREEFDDWAILFNPETADAVGINPVGVAAWKRMDGRHTVDQIVAEIRRDFSQVPETVASDVDSFIQKLIESGFVGYEVEAGG